MEQEDSFVWCEEVIAHQEIEMDIGEMLVEMFCCVVE
jgi:hypothetical protein